MGRASEEKGPSEKELEVGGGFIGDEDWVDGKEEEATGGLV